MDTPPPMADDFARASHAEATVSREVIQKRSLAILAFASVVMLGFVGLPLFAGLFLGALTAFTLLPLHERMVARVHRRWIASLICAVSSWALVVGALSAIVVLLIVRGSTLAATIQHASSSGGVLAKVEATIVRPLQPLGVKPEDMSAHLQSGADQIATQSAKILAGAGVISIRILMGVAFMVLTIFFMLEKWPTIVRGLEDLLPLRPDHTKKLLDSLRAIGREVMVGTVGVGLAQAALATLGYLVCGAPDPAFYGAMTAVASLVPGVGTMCVWVPMGCYLIATGKAAGGIALLLIGTFVVVGFCDGVLRPKLTGGSGAGFFPTLIGLFGGIEIFGVMGLVVGPTVVGFALAVLRLYLKERKNERTARPPTTATVSG